MENTSELNNYIISFGGCDYTAAVYRDANLKIVDCSDLPGTHLYCDEEAGRKISDRISGEGIRGIHFIDTGNYHYVSKFMTDQVRTPFVLIQIDHHTDMQETAFGGLLSCGSWAGAVLRENPNAAACLLIGPPESSICAVPEDILEKVAWISEEMLAEDAFSMEIRSRVQHFFAENKDLPVYVSIDKDVLEKKEAVTDWDQGILTIEQLCGLLGEVLPGGGNILGIDICGGTALSDGTEDCGNIQKINEACDISLYRFLCNISSCI